MNTKYKSLSKVIDLPRGGRVKKKVSSDGLVGCLFRREVTFWKQISQHDTSHVGEIITVASENCLIPMEFVMLSRTLNSIWVQ